ncbi:16S rRNA (adenine(1518)-N(6)/adenine(1519)-N(6))-dimethyltransferase RsmA [Steroidobacter sp. S1-65]|uniref:Ribosomal RNA small subunit methyltransferase A n=1 Tax=Steroidobacter gossypii TaxID=2805490 RepID=A0ABS1X5G0_9GAMM|nr:16S rRNA (adenine(1518)-N(6)/adenine(1519)-N(6))-dimethyltransferase RsmA [Steroidobacter gossypii]MBM0108467.1 16S rRNA (adenine(1518)-N(6)/adenine(1519)-N(6))-dimethyltransferase RsmA [Steroidobacter gossypii]
MHQPRKRFGQHFLHDPGVIGRIVAAIAPQPQDRMVEIGPGLGALTIPLLARLNELHAVEIDRDAIRHLRDITSDDPRLQIHSADVLEFSFAHIYEAGPKSERLRLVGNLPYNISTPLLFHLIEQRALILDMHFMLQKEVVDRMAAAPGSEHYGRLTVMLAPWVRVEPLFDIGPGAFRPPPKVVSTVVRLTPHETPLQIGEPRQFATVVAAAFQQRRKTLRNALKPLLDTEDIVAAGIDPGLRAEVLSPAEFIALSQRLAAKSHAAPDGPAE